MSPDNLLMKAKDESGRGKIHEVILVSLLFNLQRMHHPKNCGTWCRK